VQREHTGSVDQAAHTQGKVPEVPRHHSLFAETKFVQADHQRELLMSEVRSVRDVPVLDITGTPRARLES
jgi:hypothetical protein